MKAVSKDWLNSAESDLSTIEHILHDEALTHQVAFHAQQAIEKCLKAIIEEYDLSAIKTHSLSTLIGLTGNFISLSIDENTIISLDELYIDARYPGESGLLPFGKPSMEEAKDYYRHAKNVFKEVNELLENTK